MNDKQRKRLKRFADFLDRVPNKKFDLSSFTDNRPSKFDDEVLDEKEGTTILVKALKNKDCGTTGCACGYLPVFSPSKWEYDYCGDPKLKDSLGDVNSDLDDYFGLHCSTNMFDENDDFDYLFQKEAYPRGKRTPRHVAARLRDYLKNGRPEKYKKYAR